jgi:alpha-1,6-mannosyltransferase
MLATRSIRRIIEHERPDIIEVGSPFLVPWITRRAARRYDVPLVMFFHSNFPRAVGGSPGHESPFRRRAQKALWRYVRRLNAEFEATIVASEFMARDLELNGAQRVIKIPLGVDLEHFHPRRRLDRTLTRLTSGIPVDAPVMAFVGRFSPEKEIDVLIRAWPAIERQTDAYLVLVGDGPARRELQALSTSNRILWLPYQNDREQLADFLAAVDLVASPGSIETFGLSALEAQASGTPVLSADRGGVAEQVARSGAGGVFASGNSDELAAEAVRLLRSADLERLGALGRDYAEREHSWNGVFDRIFDIYRRVVA